jgi:DNA repair exonuclease SbcCD ATPase subunit
VAKSSTHHRSIVWSKQKLDELDALLTELDASTAKLKGDMKAEATQARDKIRASRDAFRAYVDNAEKEAAETVKASSAKAKAAVKDAQADIEAEWVEAELAFQEFIAAVADDAEMARKALIARAKAEREAIDASLDRIDAETAEAMESARKDLDAALDRLSSEADKVQAKAGQVSAAGAESWQAIRAGLKEAHAVHARTAKTVAQTFERLR